VRRVALRYRNATQRNASAVNVVPQARPADRKTDRRVVRVEIFWPNAQIMGYCRHTSSMLAKNSSGDAALKARCEYRAVAPSYDEHNNNGKVSERASSSAR